MSASVRTEDEAFSDIRYEVLATAAGLSDADHARGKMLRLWRQCTLAQSYVLSTAEVAHVLGERGPDALVSARLGEYVDGGIRIRGTKGRIEWLGRLRKASKKGGRANRAKWLAKREPTGSPPAEPVGLGGAGAEKSPPSPAPAPAPAPAQNENPDPETQREKTHTRARAIPVPPTPVHGTERGAQPDPVQALARRALADALWQEHQDTRRRVAVTLGHEDEPPPLAAMDLGRTELAARVLELSCEGLESAEERCRHVLARVAKDCIRDRTLRYLDGGVWESRRFYRSNAIPLADEGGRSNGRARSGFAKLIDTIVSDDTRGKP